MGTQTASAIRIAVSAFGTNPSLGTNDSPFPDTFMPNAPRSTTGPRQHSHRIFELCTCLSSYSNCCPKPLYSRSCRNSRGLNSELRCTLALGCAIENGQGLTRLTHHRRTEGLGKF